MELVSRQAEDYCQRENPPYCFQYLYRHLNGGFLFACWHDLNEDAASAVEEVAAAPE